MFLVSHQRLKSNGWSHTTNTKSNKEEVATSLDCKEIEFPISKKAIIKLKDKIITTLIFSKVYPIYLSKNLKIIKNYCCWRKKIKLQNDKSHHVYIKDFNRIMHNRTKHRKIIYRQIVSNALAVKKYCQKFCLEVNSKQSAKMPKKGCNKQFGITNNWHFRL